MSQKTTKNQTASLLQLATTASVATALLLLAVKFAAWLLTGSLSVMASMLDSLMDGVASLINLFAVRFSLKSPDAQHGFGHGKAEALAGLGQACFISGSALFLLINGVERLANPLMVQDPKVGICVMLLAIIATLILLAIQYYVIRKTKSVAIRADSLHYATDLLTNSGTIIALLLIDYGFPLVDPLFCIFIALFILYSAWRIGYDAVQLLMDRQLPKERLEKICRLAHDGEEVLGVHDLRTRQAGQTTFIQFHLDLNEDMPLKQAHAIAKKTEKELLALFPQADIIIHQDPVPAAQGKADFDQAECLRNKSRGKGLEDID